MKHIWIFLFCLLTFTSWAERSIKIIVNSGNYDRKDCIVSVDAAKLGFTGKSDFVLFEKEGYKQIPVKSQLIREKNGTTSLYWILNGNTPAGTSRQFSVLKTKPSINPDEMTVEDTHRALILKNRGKNILQYNYAVTYPPAGVDSAYKRSGYIHPAYSPTGNVLTTIQPKDHRHHYGIWNPWTHIVYDGTLYDLWNLGDKKGTVKAKNVEAIYEGRVCAGYDASLDHYIFTPQGEQLILHELWKVKAWDVSGGFLWDFESDLMPATSLPVLLQQYRYAGFGWRATEEWTRNNSEMFTSEGKNRQEIDGTTARWIYVTGQCTNGRSGFLILGCPENYNSPEPLRIWDENANGGRGDVFVNFAPTKNKDWELQPNKKYKLRYRIFMYDGEMTKELADRLWNDYAYPPQVIVK
ncbi:MAG: PmoA family protein [Parabacteroides sp.]